jgi:ABC-2 type transport system ATP-binding protein
VNILHPTSGTSSLLGTNSTKLSPKDFQQIGYVSENQELPGWMTLDYFLAYLKPFYPRWDDALAQDLVREFHLPGDRRLSQLSRGMRMKAALASSLAYRPPLIILDEPFNGLDPLARDEFVEGLLERATNTTILISSHDLAEVESFASHIGFMSAGRIQCSEEIGSLTNRFREIEVTLSAADLPAAWPDHWSKPQTSGAVLRFVESRFDETRTASDLAEIFPQAIDISVRPLSLREIFKSLAKGTR